MLFEKQLLSDNLEQNRPKMPSSLRIFLIPQIPADMRGAASRLQTATNRGFIRRVRFVFSSE
jgi:hypothetical protein